MYDNFREFLRGKSRLCIIQAENPDGDSLGSAIALDYILGAPENVSLFGMPTQAPQPPEISLYCPVDVPKYLHYFDDWSRVSIDFDFRADAYIVVDTAATVLLSKLLDDPAIKNSLYNKPVLVLDHHETPDDLDFPHQAIIESRPACADLICQIAKEQNLTIPKEAAEALYYAISSDTLGLVSASVTSATMRTMADLIDLGANPAALDEHRRDFMKKSPRILDYKADLIKRIEYSLDGQLATVHIPFDDIQKYSDEYNPNVLILEELRLVEGVEIAVAIKTYPDGKVTGKIRASLPIADQVAGYFGGGGHPYAAGFRAYDLSYEDVVADLVSFVPALITAAQNAQSSSDTEAKSYA